MLDSRVRRILVALDRFKFAVPSHLIIDPNTCPPGVMGATLLRAKREGLVECNITSHNVREWLISDAGKAAIRQ
jgi:hypothetical protein